MITSAMAREANARFQKQRIRSFMEDWHVIPKLMYFMLHLHVYCLQGIMIFILLHQWKLHLFEISLLSCSSAATFIGAVLWSHLADRTGRYRSILVVTAIVHAIFAAIVIFPIPSIINQWFPASVVAGTALCLCNFFMAAAFPLMDARIMAMLAKQTKFMRNQFANQRIFGSIGHFVSTISMFGLSKLAAHQFSNQPVALTLTNLSWNISWISMAQFGFVVISSILFIITVLFYISDTAPAWKQEKKELKPSQRMSALGENRLATETNLHSNSSLHTISSSSSRSIVADSPILSPSSIDQAAVMHSPFSNQSSSNLSVHHLKCSKSPILQLLTNVQFLILMTFVLMASMVRFVSSFFYKPIIMQASFEAFKEAFHLNSIESLAFHQWNAALTEGPRILSEVAVYFVTPFTRQFMDVSGVLIASQMIGTIRLLILQLTPIKLGRIAFGVFILVELLKGFSTGLISSCIINMINNLAPEGCESLAQKIYSGTFTCLSPILAGVLSAGIFGRLGPNPSDFDSSSIWSYNQHVSLACQSLMGIFAVWSLAITVLMTLKFALIDRVMSLPFFPRRKSIVF